MIARSFAGALLLSASVQAQSVPVTVVNTAAHSVPTTVTNTPAVTVANTPSVTIANTPAVTVSGTPTVTVANQPSAGTPYREVLGVQITGGGGVAGEPGLVVPAGKRRIVTTVSARWLCSHGSGALVQIFGEVGFFLPGNFLYTDAMGRDTYAMISQVNIMMSAGSQFVPIIESNGGICLADIFVTGHEVPEQP
jgi:hypothetical protein